MAWKPLSSSARKCRQHRIVSSNMRRRASMKGMAPSLSQHQMHSLSSIRVRIGQGGQKMPRLAKIDRKVEYFPIIGGEIKATNDAKGIVEGYLNYIGNIDFGDDRTMPGAFKKTLSDSYARKTQQSLDYLWPYLFNHDYSQLPPGGIFEANEDRRGLYIKTQFNLDIQMGRELYSSFKMGTMKKQSMGYKAIQVDWVKEDGRSIRNLLEVAVMEGSAVVFPMNDLAQVDTVKRSWQGFSGKGSASGKTSWPLADRNTTWDAGQAKKDIQAWAT